MAVLLAVAGGSSCSDKGKPTAKAPAQQAKSALTSTLTGTAAQAKPEEKAAAIYVYNPAGRRHPFTPIIIMEEKKAQVGPKAPLVRYPINEFVNAQDG